MLQRSCSGRAAYKQVRNGLKRLQNFLSVACRKRFYDANCGSGKVCSSLYWLVQVRFSIWVRIFSANTPLTVCSRSVHDPLTIRSRSAHGPFIVRENMSYDLRIDANLSSHKECRLYIYILHGHV